jgi:hypothetical protein
MPYFYLLLQAAPTCIKLTPPTLMPMLSHYTDTKDRSSMDGRCGGVCILSPSEYCYTLLWPTLAYVNQAKALVICDVHHVVISNNMPVKKVVADCRRTGKHGGRKIITAQGRFGGGRSIYGTSVVVSVQIWHSPDHGSLSPLP